MTRERTTRLQSILRRVLEGDTVSVRYREMLSLAVTLAKESPPMSLLSIPGKGGWYAVWRVRR